MNTNRISHALLALSLFTLAACGTGSSHSPHQVAMARPTTDTPVSGPAPGVEQKRIADEVLHDPAQRFALMERVRTQVVSETRQVPEARWQGEVRPALRQQLQDAGLARGDVDFLLWEIDQAKVRAE